MHFTRLEHGSMPGAWPRLWRLDHKVRTLRLIGPQHADSCHAGHLKAVSRIAMDPASTRILSGSRDYTMHMYDFGGMKADMKAFRTLTPSEGHPVLAASWSTTGVPSSGQ